MKKLLLAMLPALLLFAACEKSVDQSARDASQTSELGKAIGGKVVWTQTVQLRPEQEVSATPIMTTAKGVAILQLTEDNVLYSKILVTNLPEDDAIRFGHIHEAPAGVNGPVRVTLLHTAEDVGEQMMIPLSPAQVDMLMNASLYVNVHSNMYPGGILRGQIR